MQRPSLPFAVAPEPSAVVRQVELSARVPQRCSIRSADEAFQGVLRPFVVFLRGVGCQPRLAGVSHRTASGYHQFRAVFYVTSVSQPFLERALSSGPGAPPPLLAATWEAIGGDPPLVRVDGRPAAARVYLTRGWPADFHDSNVQAALSDLRPLEVLAVQPMYSKLGCPLASAYLVWVKAFARGLPRQFVLRHPAPRAASRAERISCYAFDEPDAVLWHYQQHASHHPACYPLPPGYEQVAQAAAARRQQGVPARNSCSGGGARQGGAAAGSEPAGPHTTPVQQAAQQQSASVHQSAAAQPRRLSDSMSTASSSISGVGVPLQPQLPLPEAQSAAQHAADGDGGRTCAAGPKRRAQAPAEQPPSRPLVFGAASLAQQPAASTSGVISPASPPPQRGPVGPLGAGAHLQPPPGRGRLLQQALRPVPQPAVAAGPHGAAPSQAQPPRRAGASARGRRRR